MNAWMNKNTGDIVLAHPQWEPLTINFTEKDFDEIAPELKIEATGRKIVQGTLIQAGWLLQNKNDVWMGLPMSVEAAFEDLGEL